MMRLTVSMSDEKYQALKEFSVQTGASMSSLANIAISSYLDQQNMLKMMPEMLMTLKQTGGLKVDETAFPSLLDTIETTPAKKKD